MSKKYPSEKYMRFYIAKLLAKVFKDDPKKIALWLMEENPLCGNVPPCYFILLGRTHKLFDLVKALENGDM